MKFRTVVLSLVACLLLVTLVASPTVEVNFPTTSAIAEEYTIGYVRVDSNSYLNVRESASSDSKSIGKLYLNNPVQVVALEGNWYKIIYGNSYAYVHMDYIKAEPYEVYYDDVNPADLKNSNIPYLPVRYVGYLTENTGAYPLKSSKRNCYIPAGPIAIFSIQGDYAIIAKDRTLLRIGVRYFESITPLDPNADACQEPVIAAYTTFFSTSNSNRANNIRLGAEAMKIKLAPGQQYSFNGIVGKRTPEKGYLMANAFKGQEVIQDYGGGVCQLSSTLYAAIRLNNYLPVTERYDHSMEVTYLPIGMDATVNWNNRDIKFINNYPFNIYVNTYINRGMLTITIHKVP